MELVQYIRLVRKWLWLILLAAFVAGGVSFIVNTGRPPVYEAQTTISIGRYIESPNPDSSEIRTGIELAQTYAQIVQTTDVLQATIDRLNLTDMAVTDLRRLISTRILTGTSLLVITVTYNDPVLTADIANNLAEQLILQSPTNLTPEQQAQINSANARISELTDQISESQGELDLINRALESESDAESLRSLREDRNIVIEQINQASATIAQFTNTIATLQQRTNSLQIIERARVPTSPSGASIFSTLLLGTMVGAALAIGLALLIEYLDDTIRTTEDAAQMLALPVLGAVVRFGKKGEPYADKLVVNQASMSPIAESYRTLRTNLLYSTANPHRSIYIITSPGPEEGKSVTTANLAITMALAGLQVLLIDADLRRPKVHEIFGLDNSVGLTTLLFADPSVPSSNGTSKFAGEGEDKIPSGLKACLQNTSIPRLRVITSGFIPSNPTEILGSALMQRWIDAFYAAINVDVILFDTPPCLMMADSSILAATIKGEIVLVLDCGRTRRGAALRVKEQFSRLGVTVRGVVVNRVNPRDEAYDYGYGYGYYYAMPEPKDGSGKGLLPRIGRRKERS
jgi:Mrp family chromosome partitioning ATPase/capsular polysaccharide biosynthesis protein